MPTPIRWLHLSDFHVGKDDYESRKIFNHIHDHVREQCESGFVPDLVFITGDIANSGLESEYDEFITQFLEPLRKAFGDTWPGNIFAVPGNHDLQRKFVKVVSRDERLKTGSIFFRANNEGQEERRLHELRAFEEFGNFIMLSYISPDNWLDSEVGAFTRTIDLKGVTIGIVGINTAWLSRDKDDKEQLSPGIDLLEAALKKIEKCDLRILLGHHPLDWCIPKHHTHIQNLLGDFRILYLHGHLHETRSQPLATGGGKFLQIQAGAAFQVMEHDETKWRNGLLWGEVDPDLAHIRLQPRYWKDRDRRWGIADDLHEDRRSGENWWVYPLPGTEEFAATQKQRKLEAYISLPSGWKRIDDIFLKEHSRQELHGEMFLRFFDGAIPIWHREFLHAIPPRRAVGEAVQTLQGKHEVPHPIMVLLSGAGGEGKSTALLQSALRLYESGDWNVLWREKGKEILTQEMVRNLPDDKPWLIVSDDADQIVKNLSDIVSWLVHNRSDVHFLLAARKSDWYAEGGTEVGWSQYCDFREITLGILYLEEAQSIVNFWSAYGEAGLKALYGIAPDEAARRLLEASEDELHKGEGAFLGAMLKVRMAVGLREHVKLLLSRLKTRTIGGSAGHTLLDAFAAIAFMHAEGLDFLSAPVLAQHIYGDPEKSIRGGIITPLGREAAATTARGFLFTRHNRIAKTAVELLEDDFGLDRMEIFSSLGKAALEARPHAYIPDFKKWEYDYPKHFLTSKRESIVFAIARAQLGVDPDNPLLLTNLANLYREAGEPETATQLFREFKGDTRNVRGFYYEWGTAEGNAGNQALSVWLDAASLSDWHFSSSPDNDQAKLSFAGLGVAFGALYDAYHDTSFRDARGACGVLGLTLRLDPTTQGFFIRYISETIDQGTPKMEIDQAFQALEQGIAAAWQHFVRDEKLTAKIPAQNEMTFEGLKSLIRRASARKER